MRACTVANHRDDLGNPFTCEGTKMEMSMKGKNADATCPDNAEMIQLQLQKKKKKKRKRKAEVGGRKKIQVDQIS